MFLILVLLKCCTVGLEVSTSNNFFFTSGPTRIPSISSLCGTSCYFPPLTPHMSCYLTLIQSLLWSHMLRKQTLQSFFSPLLCLVVCFTEGLNFHVPPPQKKKRFKCHDISLLALFKILLTSNFIHSKSDCVCFFSFCLILHT